MTEQQATLRRSLSLPLTTFYGLGNILGAGIYVLIGKIALHAGVYAPAAFVTAALLAALTALSYAELAARFPLSAGAAVYVHEGTGSVRLATLVGLLIVAAGSVSSAAILRGFAGYLRVFVDLPQAAVVSAAALALGGLAAWGISESVRAAAFATAVEVGGLLLIVWVAGPALFEAGPGGWAPESGTGSGIAAWQGVLLAVFLAFFAFTGFEDMVNVAEEVRHPTRNLPLAILLALAIATGLYLVVALVTVASVPTTVLGAADAPLALVYQHATGRDPLLITAISLFAVINGALIQIIMVSRVLYGMARRGWLPARLGRVHPVTHTPLAATALAAATILALALWLPIETLAKATSFVLLMIFALVNLSLWRIQGRTVRPAGVVRVPRWVPATGFATSTLFVVVQAISDLAGQ